MGRFILTVGLLCGIAGAFGPAQAASFDGRWSVLIVTERGDCDRGYRYEVGVRDGRLIYTGEGSFSLTGSVAPSGAIKARVAKGSQYADAIGRLSASSGAGRWQGRGSAGACSGHWEAERR